MAGVRDMLARVRRLEAARSMLSPIQRWYGSVEAFEAEVRVGMDAGTLDRRDMEDILACVRSWHNNPVWQLWS